MSPYEKTAFSVKTFYTSAFLILEQIFPDDVDTDQIQAGAQTCSRNMNPESLENGNSIIETAMQMSSSRNGPGFETALKQWTQDYLKRVLLETCDQIRSLQNFGSILQ